MSETAKRAGRNRAAALATATILVALALTSAWSYRQMLEARAQQAKAQRKEREAKAGWAIAESDRARGRRSLREFSSMSDIKQLSELEAELAALGPQSWKIARIERWLDDATAIRARIPQHERVLARLARSGQPLDTAQRWQKSLLADLLPRLKHFVSWIDPVSSWPAAAAVERKRSIEQQRAAWDKALGAIAASKRYTGLSGMAPQEGLLPLGPDPACGLWEFVHLPSGQPPRRRDANGRWVIEPASGIVLVLIPGGTFRMGGGALANSKPAHPVRLQPFFLGKYEVTQAQWLRLARAAKLPADRLRPSRWKPGANLYFRGGAAGSIEPHSLTNPVEQVSWDDCMALVGRAGLVLPTEAQWEYAARAGSRSTWWCGTETASIGARRAGNVADWTYRLGGGSNGTEIWTDGYVMTAPAGRFSANRFGLHDVIGNVWEWCRDPYLKQAYRAQLSNANDGSRQFSDAQRRAASARILRGGSFSDDAADARSRYRAPIGRGYRVHDVGLRAARIIVR